jgi:AcrR family transcriptional regulator
VDADEGRKPDAAPGAAGRRSVRAHRAILAATTELLAEVGYRALTIEGVAARAGVGKTTVYRWWPSKGALVIEAISQALPAAAQPDTGDLRQDLISAVERVVHTLTRTPAGAVIPALAADAMTDPDLSERLRNQLVRPRRSALAEVLLRAAARGELPADVDTDLLLDVYAGAVFHRVLISGEPISDRLAEQLVNLLLDRKPPVKAAAPPISRQPDTARGT